MRLSQEVTSVSLNTCALLPADFDPPNIAHMQIQQQVIYVSECLGMPLVLAYIPSYRI